MLTLFLLPKFRGLESAGDTTEAFVNKDFDAFGGHSQCNVATREHWHGTTHLDANGRIVAFLDFR